MSDPDLVTRYNYDDFVPAKYEPWMRFDDSPGLGTRAPSFALLRQDDRAEAELKRLWRSYRYLVLEFGSLT